MHVLLPIPTSDTCSRRHCCCFDHWCTRPSNKNNTDNELWRNNTNVNPSVLKAQYSREREMFYLTTHSTHFIYGYMASDIWLRTILIVRKETRCRHIGYYRLTARVLLYAPSHIQDDTYHGLCYTSRGALAGTRNSSMGPPHEGSIRRPTAPWANALPLSYVPLPLQYSILHIPYWLLFKNIFYFALAWKLHQNTSFF